MSCACEEKKVEIISKDPKTYISVLVSLLIFTAIGIILYFTRIPELFAFSTVDINIGVALLLGITAGFSTCMALVGGIVLAISARFAEIHPQASTAQRWRPQIVFNLGRVIIFGLLGGLIGYLGSFVSISASFIGITTFLIAIYMLYLGIQLTQISPKLTDFTFTLPKAMTRYVRSESLFLLGGLTFFLPCGFTQAVQLAAVASGSALAGALIMSLFAIGTTPGLLVVGALGSSIHGKKSRPILIFVGVLVVILSLINIRSSFNLMSLGVSSKPKTNNAVTVDNGTQVVRMTVTEKGYSPNSFVVKKGVPVRWEIDVKDLNTCASFLLAPQIVDFQILKRGINVIEFTPGESGELNFSCSMGMYSGKFVVE